MKDVFKILSVIFAVLLAVSLCACGGSKGGNTVTKSAETGNQIRPETNAVTVADVTEGTAADTAAETEELPYTVAASLKEANVSDVIVFGSYEQDGNAENGKEPLEWLVLEKSGNTALVISLYAVESGVFNETRDYVTWETSTIRTWLNNDFINAAFSTDERSCIKTSTVIAEPNPEFPDVPYGSDTEDKIFLLSISEAEQYFKNVASRMCSPTEGMVNNGGFTVSKKPWYAKRSYACLWWLRSPGMDKLKIAYIDKGGSVSYGGNQVDYNNKTCIRPAMRLTVS